MQGEQNAQMARALGTGSTVGYIAGGVTAASGALLIYLGYRAGRRVSIAPAPLVGGGAIVVGGVL
jgi:hypothetical protein